MIQNFKNYKLILFDLDDTLAVSKSPVDFEMTTLLGKLLEKKMVGIISGGKFEQFKTQVVNMVSKNYKNPSFSRLFICATSGAKMFEFKNDNWECFSSDELSKSESAKIISAIEIALKEFGFDDKDEPKFGERLEDRETQITFSAFGQFAPPELKAKWDPDKSKRNRLKEIIKKLIPEFEVKSGGSTSIDITKKGIDKGYGTKKLLGHLSLDPRDLLFVGDRLDKQGNDYPVKKLGVACIEVKNIQETKDLIEKIISKE